MVSFPATFAIPARYAKKPLTDQLARIEGHGTGYEITDAPQRDWPMVDPYPSPGVRKSGATTSMFVHLGIVRSTWIASTGL